MPTASQLEETPGTRKWLQLLPLFRYSPGREQPKPLLAIKAGKYIIATKVGPQPSPASWKNLSSHWCPHMNFKNVLKFADNSGSSRPKSRVRWRLCASTAHCSNSVISPAVKNPIKLVASPSCGFGDSSTGVGEGGDGDGDSGLSATPGTTTSKGILTGLGATTPTTTYSCSIYTSLSAVSPNYSSYWSILQQQNFRPWSHYPLLLSRLLFSMIFWYLFLLTPSVDLLNSSPTQIRLLP